MSPNIPQMLTTPLIPCDLSFHLSPPCKSFSLIKDISACLSWFGLYSRMPQSGQLINNSRLSLTILNAGKSKIRVPASLACWFFPLLLVNLIVTKCSGDEHIIEFKVETVIKSNASICLRESALLLVEQNPPKILLEYVSFHFLGQNKVTWLPLTAKEAGKRLASQ